MDNKVIEEFIKFYVFKFNEKSNDLLKLYKSYSKIIYNKVVYDNNNILPFLNELTNNKINLISYEYNINGFRKADIILNCDIVIGSEIKKMINYISFCLSNSNEYWIHSHILIIT